MSRLKIIVPIKPGERGIVSVPKEEYEQLKNICELHGLTMSQLTGQIIRYALKDGYDVEEVGN